MNEIVLPIAVTAKHIVIGMTALLVVSVIWNVVMHFRYGNVREMLGNTLRERDRARTSLGEAEASKNFWMSRKRQTEAELDKAEEDLKEAREDVRRLRAKLLKNATPVEDLKTVDAPETGDAEATEPKDKTRFGLVEW